MFNFYQFYFLITILWFWIWHVIYLKFCSAIKFSLQHYVITLGVQSTLWTPHSGISSAEKSPISTCKLTSHCEAFSPNAGLSLWFTDKRESGNWKPRARHEFAISLKSQGSVEGVFGLRKFKRGKNVMFCLHIWNRWVWSLHLAGFVEWAKSSYFVCTWCTSGPRIDESDLYTVSQI